MEEMIDALIEAAFDSGNYCALLINYNLDDKARERLNEKLEAARAKRDELRQQVLRLYNVSLDEVLKS